MKLTYGSLKVDVSKRIALSLNDNILLQSPAEGLWSIGTTWEEERPGGWKHAEINNLEQLDDCFVVSGEIALPNGRCACSDSCSFEHNMLKIVRRWQYEGEDQPCVTLSLRWQQPRPFGRLLMPGILYYGNPSGARSGKVPVMPMEIGAKGFFEEHRFPAPYVSSEQDDGTMAALHVKPSLVVGAQRQDLWWTLGAEYKEQVTELACMSGYVSGNGQDGMVKGNQAKWLPMTDCFMTLKNGMIIEKTFWLQIGDDCQPGWGFCPAQDASINLWKPATLPLDGNNLVQRKYKYGLTRYYMDDNASGSAFLPFGAGKLEIVYGWCGRSETYGYAAPILGESCGDKDWRKRAQTCFDFMCQSPIDDDGFCVRYDVTEKRWYGRDFVSQGQALETFTMAMLDQRQQGEAIPDAWLDFLKRACDVLATRVLKDTWNPVSTNEGFLALPLANAYALLGDTRFKDAAVKLAEHYLKRHGDMTEPYWGGTLDAQCEDKEGAYAGMLAFHSVWQMTQDTRFLKALEHATQVFLTYLQVWDIPMPPGRLADHAFASRGWTAVSVQNMHLDVFGVWATPLIWQAGHALKRPAWQNLAIPMFVNCGQLMDIYGSQGEQIQQTNYAQRPPYEPVDVLRGGYAEHWTVFWITAAFLNAAAQFARLGVKL